MFEFLAAALIVGVISSAIGMMLMAHWSAYNTTLYQNRVNMEARRALDAICDDIRLSGYGQSQIASPNPQPQVYWTGIPVGGLPSSDQNNITIYQALGGLSIGYTVPDANNPNGSNPNNLLERMDPGRNNNVAIAMYISQINLEYEYRQRSTDPTQPWIYYRTPTPEANGSSEINELTAIYVTVTATIPTSVTGAQAYTRTLTSAVHFRAPYNANVL